MNIYDSSYTKVGRWDVVKDKHACASPRSLSSPTFHEPVEVSIPACSASAAGQCELATGVSSQVDRPGGLGGEDSGGGAGGTRLLGFEQQVLRLGKLLAHPLGLGLQLQDPADAVEVDPLLLGQVLHHAQLRHVAR